MRALRFSSPSRRCWRPPSRAIAAFQASDRAYTALRARDYDVAVPAFLAAIQAAPDRADIRKDLAYTLLKIGEPALARDQFREAMRLDPADTAAALEYAFLCYETKQQAEARRVFDRLRRTGNATAEQAFHNIDDPLAAGIARWQKAIEMGADNFSGHFELATLAEQRDELALAATHFERAWRLLPDRRTVLVDLGRVWLAMGRTADATAALLAASRGGEPRAAEMARELLPARYPFVSEFRQALALDPANHDLRRELGYLLLRMGRAERSRGRVPHPHPERAGRSAVRHPIGLPAVRPRRKDRRHAVVRSRARRARTTIWPTAFAPSCACRRCCVRAPPPRPTSIDAKIMAERSIKAGYMKDALKYLEAAHESDPGDFDVMRKLGWTNNILHRDAIAWRWFDLARRSPDPTIAADARAGISQSARRRAALPHHGLAVSRSFPRAGTTCSPTARSRPRSTCGFPCIPMSACGLWAIPAALSAPAVRSISRKAPSSWPSGAATRPWHGITAWGEAGTAISYLKGHMLPDYRGGLSVVALPAARGQRLAGRRHARCALHEPFQSGFSGLHAVPRRIRFRPGATSLERQCHG